MTTANLLRASTMALMLAVTGPAFADSWFSSGGTWHGGSTMDPLRDESGIAVLGVDVGPGGSTPAVAANFVAGLRPDLQAQVVSRCAVMNPNTTTVNVAVVRFCNALNRARGF